ILKDGIHLVVSRAKLMAGLAQGSMLAVCANHEQILHLITDKLSLSAINSPNVSVIAGPTDQINKLIEVLKSLDIACKLVQTSHAFHSSMMDPIVSPFREVVESLTLNIPQTPIISTLTGQWMKDAEAIDPTYWAKHLRSTVQFADSIKTLVEEGTYSIILECGPGTGSTTSIKQQTNNKS